MNRQQSALLIVAALAGLLMPAGRHCQPQQAAVEPLEEPLQAAPTTNYPYYLQSPIAPAGPLQHSPPHQIPAELAVARGLSLAKMQKKRPTARKISVVQEPDKPAPDSISPNQAPALLAEQTTKPDPNSCLYGRRYFEKLDHCLARKPYPTVGLLAFKNEDLLVKRGLSERHGCQLVLNSGLFKNYLITGIQVDSDGECLDNAQVSLSMDFSNVTMAYLWSLRCLNKADQLLDDATLDGHTVEPESGRLTEAGSGESSARHGAGLCVGSSQNFGFASLQVSGMESQVELALDIYRNWRVTNVTLAMLSSAPIKTGAESSGETQATSAGDQLRLESSIRDFVFESLDGDELNWRYLQLYQNWARNRMHSTLLDQFRRFLWISLQRCLSESSERLPVKLLDVFTDRKYT